MTNDDSFFDVSCNDSLPTDSKGVIKRVFHTRTEFRVYPNGTIYPEKTQAWFEDKAYPVKPKEPKKALPVKDSVLKTIEEY